MIALLLAPLPAAAAAAPSVAAASAAAAHCEDAGTGASHTDQSDDAKQPCCKNSLGSCCPAAAPLAGPSLPSGANATVADHRPAIETFLPGSAEPPLTDPPTLT
jgi:hypothetical protein